MPLGRQVELPEGLREILLECFAVRATAFPQAGLAFSDGIPTAVMLGTSYGEATFRSRGQVYTIAYAWLSGQYLENVQFEVANPGEELLIIRFNPFYFNHISAIPTHKLRNRLIWSFQEVFGKTLMRMLTDPDICGNPLKKLEVLEYILQQRPTNITVNYLLQEAIQNIICQKGNVQIDGLAKTLNVSYKWLERNFLQFTGVSPKEFARQQRFLHTYFDLVNGPDKDLPEIAFENAFYDQNHFSKEFKKFAGCSPGWFRKHYTRARK
ncbi:AraC-type DNA-binding protein [Dyadobacter sp. SG02]|nr:AraC-type DNA-binding protein [Dyadobacter sp. SG02]